MIDSKGRTYIKIYCCGDCDQYSWPMHRCKLGAHVHGNVGDCFYLDCPYLKEEKEQMWIPFKIRELTDEEKEEHPEWEFIVDCKLPENGQRILVSIDIAGHERVQFDEFYDDDGVYLDSGYEIGEEAVAWAPLPTPYQEAKHD